MKNSNETHQQLAALRAGKEARLDQALAAARDFFRPMLNEDGTWNIKLTKESGRLNMQMLTAFLRGDEADVALANKLLRRSEINRIGGNIRWNIFQTSIACQHLADSRAQLEPESIAWCEQVLTEGCSTLGMCGPDLQFWGYNDNMPSMAVKTLILTGEWLNKPELVELGMWKLRGLAEQLSAFGLIAEYNSPNYTPDTIHNLMTLYRHTSNDEAKELVSNCVCRVWTDLAAHWHTQGCCPAGPFSRAYEHDFCNYLSSQNCMLWVLLGPEVSGVSALETIKTRAGMENMHGNNPLEHTARMIWYATTDDSLLDDETAALFLEKPDNFELIATAMQGNAGALTPMKKTTTTSFIRKDYSLGTAAFAFCGGEQTTSLYVTGAGGEISPILGTKYLVNDESPGAAWTDDWHIESTGTREFHSHGTAVTVQKQSTAMASYVPHRHLADKPVSELRLAVIAPNAVGQFDGFVDAEGNDLVPDREYSCGSWFGARLGKAIVAFYPLPDTQLELPESKLVLRRNDHYDYVEIINYSGPERTFTHKELYSLLNGVVFEVASAAEWESPTAFIQSLKQHAQLDSYFTSRVRYLRYNRTDLSDREACNLVMRYTTEQDGVAIRTIDGTLAPEDTWRCSGIPADSQPYLDQPYLTPMGLPWEDLNMPKYMSQRGGAGIPHSKAARDAKN